MLNDYTKGSWRLFTGVIILGILIAAVVFAPVITGYDVAEQNSEIRLLAPSTKYLMGTDRYGRDIFTRVLYGGQTTLLAAAGALILTLVVGTLAGTIMGLYQNTVLDIILMRVIDTLMAFPFMVFAMVVSAFLGVGLFHLLIAVAVIWWAPFARISRSMVMQIRNETSVEAARVLGAGLPMIIRREIIPRIIAPILIQATFELGNLILSMSALSFLGLGVQPPAPEWGSMMSDGRAHFMQAPHVVLCPAIFVVLTVFSLNLIGESLRDQWDPYERIEF